MVYKNYKKIDKLGRVQIPKVFRDRLGLEDDEDIFMEVKDNALIISKAEESCVFCGQTDDLKSHKGFFVCADCIKTLSTT